MVKVILQLYPVIPGTREERATERPIGRNAERYQNLVREMPKLVKAAEDLGLWGVSTIEHHFHSEGYEVSPNPGLLNAYWAGLTSTINIGQLGFTMGAQNPIRIAEDIAIIDHLTGGRSFCGFSRGYQARWTNILGQHYGSRATLSPSGASKEHLSNMSAEEQAALVADDKVNREIFEENVDLVLRSWAEDSIEANGRWQIPFPYDEGVDWTMTATRELGAPGEMDENGKIRRVSVVPSTYTKPHPPVFVASNASKETIEFCGPRGFIPAYFSKIERAAEFGAAYVEAAAEVGREYALGQNQALVRWPQIGTDEADVRRKVRDHDVDIFNDLYSATVAVKNDPEHAVDSVMNSGLWLAGTPEQVKDQCVELWKQLPAEYIVLISHWGQQPVDDLIWQLEMFMKHVKPALDELTTYEEK